MGEFSYKLMVELRGFEPLTPCVQSRCSPSELQPHMPYIYRENITNFLLTHTVGRAYN